MGQERRQLKFSHSKGEGPLNSRGGSGYPFFLPSGKCASDTHSPHALHLHPVPSLGRGTKARGRRGAGRGADKSAAGAT